ncbi:MAG: DUF917 domain-containing protein [Armatimonadetes bacterium]|nr:DUF917 domain-containing protein [Armatimonadota bacterium]
MRRRHLESLIDVEDLVYGLAVLGTGGGANISPPQLGIDLLCPLIENGKRVELVGLDDLPREGWTVSAAGIGGRGPKGGTPQSELDALGLVRAKYQNPIEVAILELARHHGIERIDGLVPLELGSANTARPMVAAASLGIPIVDADYAGRALPEIGQFKPCLMGHMPWPAAYVDRWGNITINKEAVSIPMADRIGRMLSLAALSIVGHATFLLPVNRARHVAVPGTLTLAMEVGCARRSALASGRSPAHAMAQALRGWVIFEGRVSKEVLDDRAAYQFGYGEHLIDGLRSFAGHRLRVWYKNENHIAWLDGEAYISSPDCISIVSQGTGEGRPNGLLAEGEDVTVVAWPCLDPFYRTVAAVEAVGPRHFGFDIEYAPIEIQMEKFPERGV